MATTKNTKAFYNTEIPSDWEVKRFEQICNKLLDGTHFSPKSKEGPFKYITSKNVRNEGLDLGNLGHISEEEHRAIYKRCPVKYGDILLTKDGAGTGACCQNTLLEEFSLLSSVAVLNVKTDITLNEYFLQFIQSPIGQKIIQDAISGQAITRITLEKIKKFKIPLPQLPEQKAIAQVLSTADAAIHTTEKIIAQKEFRKKWLMQQLLTGKKRLKGFSGEWKKLGAGEIFKSITKKGFADEELLSATQDRGMIPRTMLEGRVTMPTTGTEGFKLVEIGDFVISLRSFQGGLEYSYYRGLVSPAYTVLKPKKSINEEFYKQYFKSYEFIGRLATAVIGIRDGKQISYDDFCIVKIPYPIIEEQTAIAQVLQAVDKEISLLKAKAEKLREQKKGLMQVLLTGKKRLNQDFQDSGMNRIKNTVAIKSSKS
jgi:type I restriction enzyme, S subunit